MASESDIVKLFGIMLLVFPNFKAKEGTPDIYAEMLKDIDFEALESAAKKLMSSSIFFPTIAEWRTAAFEIITNAPAIPSAYEAWEETLKQIREYGSYSDPKDIGWSHPLVFRAVACMGWRDLCLSEQVEYDRAHFYKIYASLLQRAQDDVRMLPDVRKTVENYQLMPGERTPEAVQHSMALLTSKLRQVLSSGKRDD